MIMKKKIKKLNWGLGIGDWELRMGPNPQSPIPNPQSPIPNPHAYSKLIFKAKSNKKLINLKIKKLNISYKNVRFKMQSFIR